MARRLDSLMFGLKQVSVMDCLYKNDYRQKVIKIKRSIYNKRGTIALSVSHLM